MAGTFDALRPNELIFNYVVSNWLLGERPPAFDILSGTPTAPGCPRRCTGSTCAPLRREPACAGRARARRADASSSGDVTSDAYVVGAINDHIVPWTASYQATQLLGGEVRYVLSSGGHIAGIVNPPGPKPGTRSPTRTPRTPRSGGPAAERHAGTWWEDWDAAGAAERAGALVSPPRWAPTSTRRWATHQGSTSTPDPGPVPCGFSAERYFSGPKRDLVLYLTGNIRATLTTISNPFTLYSRCSRIDSSPCLNGPPEVSSCSPIHLLP